ncbi:unnamed protein product [Polarella glacialis]|uniref:Prolyl 4-hydroxylase alpha subunit domain-containing protein n=1 Tax=Polarella glacialis TaxID=89957 RepID=A0A813DZ92_POLGL|nr:unnamed protein product [Polarella glacialis]
MTLDLGWQPAVEEHASKPIVGDAPHQKDGALEQHVSSGDGGASLAQEREEEAAEEEERQRQQRQQQPQLQQQHQQQEQQQQQAMTNQTAEEVGQDTPEVAVDAIASPRTATTRPTTTTQTTPTTTTIDHDRSDCCDSRGVGGLIEITRARYGCKRGFRQRVVGESPKLWKLEGAKTCPKDHEGTGWVWVEEEGEVIDDLSFSSPTWQPDNVTTACVSGYVGHVIDGALSNTFLASLDETRLGLPLDFEKKKTAAARRFLHDSEGWVCRELERALAEGLASYSKVAPRVLPWMRFLEYHEVEGALPPHTDALVKCKDTAQYSTHTLIVFASDCPHGGETVMLPTVASGVTANSKACLCQRGTGSECFAVRPVCGRIFCFPHQCLHEGRPTAVVPKILLRAELVWDNQMCSGFNR